MAHILHLQVKTFVFCLQMESFYNNFEYNDATKWIMYFVANDVSGVYCHLVKDRLYCEKIDSPYRVAATDVISSILTVLTRSVAPILPFLAEEVWLHHPQNLGTIFGK